MWAPDKLVTGLELFCYLNYVIDTQEPFRTNVKMVFLIHMLNLEIKDENSVFQDYQFSAYLGLSGFQEKCLWVGVHHRSR